MEELITGLRIAQIGLLSLSLLSFVLGANTRFAIINVMIVVLGELFLQLIPTA